MKKFLLLAFLVSLFIHFTHQTDGPSIWTQSLSNAGQIWGLAVAPSNQQIIYAASNSQGIWKSTNAGANWVQMNTGLSNLILQCVGVSATNPNIVMCGTTNTGTNPGVYRSTDGAASWTRVVTGITEPAINIQGLAIDPVNSNVAYITLFDGLTNQANGIYKTTDGGGTWVPVTNGIGAIKNFLSVTINPLNPNVVYAGTSFDPITAMGPAKMYKSVNAGGLWTDMSSGLPSLSTDVKPIRCISISRLDTAVVLAGLFVNTDSLSGMYVTTNGGGVWTRRHNGVPNLVGTLPRSCLIRPGSSTELFVGLGNAGNTGIGVFRSTDRGLSWAPFNNGLMLNTYTIRALDFKTTADSTLFAGVAHPTLPAGQGVFEYSWPPLGVNDPNTNLPSKFVLEQNYPNPFNPETVIKYSVPFASFVTVKVYNSSGKEIITLVNSQKSPGNYEISFSGEGLPSGAYFYKITADNYSETKKMILIK